MPAAKDKGDIDGVVICAYSGKMWVITCCEYKLIYSYKYDKVISKDEIRQNRKNSFYCFAMAVFLIIIIWVRIGLY